MLETWVTFVRNILVNVSEEIHLKTMEESKVKKVHHSLKYHINQARKN